jgi:hypothetical protein
VSRDKDSTIAKRGLLREGSSCRVAGRHQEAVNNYRGQLPQVTAKPPHQRQLLAKVTAGTNGPQRTTQQGQCDNQTTQVSPTVGPASPQAVGPASPQAVGRKLGQHAEIAGQCPERTWATVGSCKQPRVALGKGLGSRQQDRAAGLGRPILSFSAGCGDGSIRFAV